jgi:hypothetical protein
VLPLLMSSCVGFEAVAGRARGAFGVLLLGSSSSSVGGEVLEEKTVEDIVKARDVVVGVLVVVERKVGAQRGNRVRMVRISPEIGIDFESGSGRSFGCCYGVLSYVRLDSSTKCTGMASRRS